MSFFDSCGLSLADLDLLRVRNDTAAALVRQELSSRAELSLRSFIHQAWPVLEPGTRFVPGWHLDAMAEHLQAVTRGQIRNLLINIPPRHMKSLSVCVFWPAWEWIFRPQRRWLFASYALSLSIRDSVRCRRLIESPWYQRQWAGRFGLSPDQNAKSRFDNDRTGCRLATSVGGAATGEGGDRVVVDDPHNVRERQSESARRAVLAWWDETMSTRLNDPKTGARVIVMQRLHERDLSGHVLAQGGYVHLCLPAEFEPQRKCATTIRWTDPRFAAGELLWPQRMGPAEMADLKLRLGPAGAAGQLQQRPAPAGGGRFKAEWFRYYTMHSPSPGTPREGAGEGSELSPTGPRAAPIIYTLHGPSGEARDVPAVDCRRFAMMDPAGTEKSQNARACFTVIQVWDVTPEADMILVDQYRRQVQTPDAAEAAIRLCLEHEAAFLGVEKDGLGLGVLQTVRRSGIAVRAVKARGGKEARSETAEIRMAAGAIYFPRQAPFLWDLEQELLTFPQGEHADQVDALAHAAMMVQRVAGTVRAGMQGATPTMRNDHDVDDDDEW